MYVTDSRIRRFERIGSGIGAVCVCLDRRGVRPIVPKNRVSLRVVHGTGRSRGRFDGRSIEARQFWRAWSGV